MPASEWGIGHCIRKVEPDTGAAIDFFESRADLGGPAFKLTVTRIQRLGHVVLKTPRVPRGGCRGYRSP